MSGFEIELPSSPDPLGDETVVIPPASAAPPSTAKTRRVLQSAVSSRFSALPGTSPRKRMFALDVGDEITHQTIYVTVEAGPDGLPITTRGAGGLNVNRRLFGSPTPQSSPRRGVRTTTTTIPLRGLTDDEAEEIPRRRRRSSGRPGTPSTGAAKRRKKGTPTPKSTRKPRATPPAPSSDALQSETPAVVEQPTPRRRGRPPKRKADHAPSEQDELNASQTAPRKRGRRRQSLNPDEVDLLVTASNDDPEPPSSKSPAPGSFDAPQDPVSDPAVGGHAAADLHEDEEEDPFLAIPSDPPAGHERPRQGDQYMELSDPVDVQQFEDDPQVLEDQGGPFPESDDYPPMMEYDDRSEEGSQRSEPVLSLAPPIQQGSAELEDQGHLPGESDDYAPMMDYDDRSDVVSRHSETTPRSVRHSEQNTLELEDQGPLPGESDHYAPMEEYEDMGSVRDDAASEHSEPTPRFDRQLERDSSELEDQGPLPGESDDYVPPITEYEDRKDIRSDAELYHNEATPRAERQLERHTSELEDQGPLPGESDGYAPMAEQDDRSDVGSYHSGHTAQTGGIPDDTVDPETFTMIGIENMPSFQGNRDVPTSDLPEIGETTSLFINKTLDSLRQEMVASEDGEGEVDLLGSREPSPAEVEAERPAVTTSVPRYQSQLFNSPAKRPPRGMSQSPRKSEPVRTAAASSSLWNRVQPSQSPIARPGQNASPSPIRPGSFTARATSERSRVESSARTVRHQKPDDLESSPDELNADEDSFSDIPDDVLAAAEPQEGARPFESPVEDELGWAVGVDEHTAAEKEIDQMIDSAAPQNNEHYAHTNSTPNRPELDRADDETTSQRSMSRSAQSRRRSSQGTQQSSPPHSIRSHSDSNRLLTPPDETTSPSDHENPVDDHAHSGGAASMTPDDIGSSPPDLTSFVQEDARQASSSRRESDTPANPPPSIRLQPVQERITYAAGFGSGAFGSRPVLSPIVRAGSRLQNILSDPPSPSGRSSVLRSPFKGSVRNSSPLDGPQSEDASQSGAPSTTASENHPSQPAPQLTEPAPESPTKSWRMSFGPLGRIKDMVSHFTSPNVNVSQAPEDPFGPSSPTSQRPGSAFMDRIRQVSREESVHSSRASITRATTGDDDERNWAGEPAPRATESSARPERVQKSGLFSSGFFRSRLQHVEPRDSYDGAMDEDRNAISVDRHSEQPQTDETEPQPEYQAQTAAHQYESTEHLSGGAQSRSEEVEQPSDQDDMQVDHVPADDEHSEEDDDIWAIEADRTASSPTAQRRANESSFHSFRKSGLSIDWGTRSTISSQPGRSPVWKKSARSAPEEQPEDLETYSLLGLNSGDSNHPSAKKPTPENQKQSKRADLSDFFSSSPNFIERERRAREALLAESAAQSSGVNQRAHIASPRLTGETQNSMSPAQKQRSSSGQPSPELPWSGTKATQHITRATMSHASSSLTPERPRYPQHRPAPRPSQNDAALFETWSVSSSRAPSERPHLTDPLSDARPSSPDAFERPSTPSERTVTGLEARLLKPLPGRAASPSKSCLRSPMKPKTPGRVVEFTSSTLSPLTEAQAQARARAQATQQNKVSVLPAAPDSVPLLPNGQSRPEEKDESFSPDAPVRSAPYQKQPQQEVQQQVQREAQQPRHVLQHKDDYDYDDDDDDEAAESPLSQTHWSRRHWVALDELLQACRRNPRGFRSRHHGPGGAAAARMPSALVGKVVTSQGEEMVLEQWHLDVVDAFRGEVGGGWAEDALAKRLFALIVGEERRRLGLVPSRR